MLFAGSAMAQLSGTYTINSASATSGSNYKSFSALATDLNTNGVSGSVTVNVVPNSGPYDEDFYLEELTGSSASNTITINGNGETLSNAGTVIELEGTDHITFNELVIEDDGTSSATKVVLCYDEVEYITFDGCEVVSSASETYTNYPAYYTGSYMWFGNSNFYYQDPTDKTSNITITNCKLWQGTTTPGNKGKNFGIVMMNPSSFTGDQNIDISNNEISDFGWRGLNLVNVSGIDVTGNDMHNMYNTDPIYSYGIYLDQYFYGGTKPVNISENYIHEVTGGRTNQGERGIYMYMYYSSSDVNIVNNIFVSSDNSYQYSIQFGYSYNYSGDCNIMGNTFRLNSDGSGNRHYGIYLYYASGVNVKNNILVEESQNFTGNSWLIYEGYGANNNNYDNNVYNYSKATGSSVGSKIHVGRSANTDDETTFEDWISYTSEANSVWADPIFKDPATGDYSPRSIAMANKGAVSVFTTDYNGVTRGTTPDIGALEYFVDVEIVSVNMTGTLTECAPYTESVSISVKNNSAFDVVDIPLKYSINGGTEVKEVSATSIAAGTTATFVFDKDVVLNGSNTHVITAAVDGDDDAPANSSAMHTIGTLTSPTGGDLTMGSVFKGYFNDGTTGSEDNAVFGFENEYNILDPTVVTNYTTTMMATTDGGTDVTSSGFSLTNGTKTLVANPAVSLAGENIYMEITVLDNGTGCDTTFGRWMYVPHTPVPSFDASNICLGDVAQFKNTSTLGGTDYIITHWEFNDPDASVTDDFSDIKDGFWEYTTYGSNVAAEMTVANGAYPKFEYSLTKNVDVTPKPIVDFKVLNACEGAPITVTDNTKLPAGITGTIVYDWDFAGDYSDNTANPSYTFTT
ncbi:right-handed parallel beta-helix repeat-containing protein, partial [Bacteroidia bacterium]|nr:right-handed parallel beta-helix repeat-containing protein [Bacteroidia bacterium]